MMVQEAIRGAAYSLPPMLTPSSMPSMNLARSAGVYMSEMSAYSPPGTYSGSMKEPQSTMS